MWGHTAATVRHAVRIACPGGTLPQPFTFQPTRYFGQRPSLRASAVSSLNILVTVGTLSVLPMYATVSPHPCCGAKMVEIIGALCRFRLLPGCRGMLDVMDCCPQ